jgi:hypothetical protein
MLTSVSDGKGFSLKLTQLTDDVIYAIVPSDLLVGAYYNVSVFNGAGESNKIKVKVAGPTTQVTGTLKTPTKKLGTGYTPASQYVLGESTSKILDVNFVASGNTVNIPELSFEVSGSIKSISVAEKTSPVVDGKATFTDLNIKVPVGLAGINIPVFVTYPKIGPAQGGSVSGNPAKIALVRYTAQSGNDAPKTFSTNVVSNEMYVVASKPSVAIAGHNNLPFGTNLQAPLARVVVSADSSGNIVLKKIPINVITSGNAKFVGNVLVKVDGTKVNTTNDIISLATSTTGVINFTGGYEIEKGTSVTFEILADISVNETGSVKVNLWNPSRFIWNDVSGGKTDLTGKYIYNFPTNLITVVAMNVDQNVNNLATAMFSVEEVVKLIEALLK